jgi:hypothetical protein
VATAAIEKENPRTELPIEKSPTVSQLQINNVEVGKKITKLGPVAYQLFPSVPSLTAILEGAYVITPKP